MNKLVNAMQSGRMMGRTENGAVAHMTTANRLLDVFFAAGASRKNPENIVRMLNGNMLKNDVLARKLAFWIRDARGGAGERNVFREIMKANDDIFFNQFQLVPFYGRWDDLLELMMYQKSEDKQYQIASYYMAAVHAVDSAKELLSKIDTMSDEEATMAFGALVKNLQLSK